MAGGRKTIQGYVRDRAYPSNFHPQFTPNWIDAMLRHKGFRPPRRPGKPFALMDLGCGDGLGLIVMAAAHPEGSFVGIDALPRHAKLGARVARACGVDNVAFRCARFSDLTDPSTPGFDYVTAQGVMSWVGVDNQAHVRRIAASHLKPGGIACLGYNTLPGWKDALAFQQMVRQLADAESGDGPQRFEAALKRIRAMSKAGAPPFSKALMEWIDGLRGRLPASYFPHEYMNRHWTCFWSAEMIEAMAAHGFIYAAPGRADQLREDFTLRAAQRRQLAKIADPLARATAADIFVNNAFRIDVYARKPRRPADPLKPRLDGWWASTVAAKSAAYECRTPAGRLTFDNEPARAVLAGLDAGPSSLSAILAGGSTNSTEDMLDAVDALFIAGHILPAGPPSAAPAGAAVNAHVRGNATGISALAGCHGPMPVQAADMATPAAIKRLGIAD